MNRTQKTIILIRNNCDSDIFIAVTYFKRFLFYKELDGLIFLKTYIIEGLIEFYIIKFLKKQKF